MWKNTVAYAGLVLTAYEAVLLYQMLRNGSLTSRLSLCLGLKLVAFASIFSTREYVRTGRTSSLGQSVFFSGSYVLIWLCCMALLGQAVSIVEASPLCVLYFLASFGVLRLVGDNTKAEVARAQQLDKLQRLVGGALMCEQHKLQTEHRKGLPDWMQPTGPAGVTSDGPAQAPTYFAWGEQPKNGQQPEPSPPLTEQQVPTAGGTTARELEYSAVRERAPPEKASEIRQEAAAVTPLSSQHGESLGNTEGTAIVVDDDRAQPVENVSASAPASPPRTSVAQPVVVVEDSPSPLHGVPSPRYKYGHRLKASDLAATSPRARSLPAGVTTVAADRYRMNKSSGKVCRSPMKRTSLWDDLCSSYLHQSEKTSDDRSVAVKRAAPAAGGANASFRTSYMDSFNWPRSESSRGERRPVVTGTEALQVANRAVREFLGDSEEQPNRSQRGPMSPVTVIPDETQPPAPKTHASSAKKAKAVSFAANEDVPPASTSNPQQVDGSVPLAAPSARVEFVDSMTQTDEEPLLPARKNPLSKKQARSRLLDSCRYCEARHDSPVRCPACDAVAGEAERPKKMLKAATGDRPTQSFNHHLTNPILLNPRYPQEPMTFRGRSTYSTEFGAKVSRR
ncbi:hypothetical protein BBJ28_00017569 [Nothophytophthora sp. Chile5]|nr:hypothetical protein BBJ28_00017569 [Nothophytophthora sp. Chile5]